MENILDGLNKEQKQAVTYDKGPLLIIAGAGTGKTTVITRRIAYLISQKKAKPEEILALTFTDKAAAEMEERVDVLVPYGFIDTWISTFHSFGDRILHDHALDIGLPSDFQVLSRSEQAVFIKDHLFEFDLDYYRPLGNPLRHIDALLSLFSRIKDENISASEYLSYAKKRRKIAKTKEEKEEALREIEVADTFNRYQELMLREGNIDFGDQIVLALKLFREKPKILKEYQKQFKYILVDEFQDTNYAQNELVKILAGKNGNISVVADDDQSIYRFRGAAVSNVLEFKKNFLKAKQIVLIKNYRSTKQILDQAYKLIQYNNPDRLEFKNKINKRLESDRQGMMPSFIECDSLTTETFEVASIIAKKVKSRKYNFRDFAILVRKNDQAKPFMKSLAHYEIPFKFAGSTGLYAREEIRLILSFLGALTDHSDSLALYNLITSEIYKMPVREAIKLNTWAFRNNRSLLFVLENYQEINGLIDLLNQKTIKIIDKVNQDLDKFSRYSSKDTSGQLIYQFLKDTGYLKYLVERSHKNIAFEAKLQNIAIFFEKVKEFEHVSSDKSVLNFKKHIDTLIEAGEDPATADIDPDLDAVNILTVHKAKGLEFKVVFLVNLYNGSFPTRRQPEPLALPDDLIKETLPEGDYHLEEERRLLYVALTRACDELYLLVSNDYGGKKQVKISQFILEFLDIPKIDASKIKLGSLEIIKKQARTEEKILLKQFYNGEGILKLNPHQIDDYLSCPLKFKYIHILKIPILKHHPVIYGSAIHKAIEEYFSRKLNKHKVKLTNLINIFGNSWESAGFVTREHEEKRLEAGRKALSNFFKREEKNKKLPSFVERKFSFVLNTKPRVRISGRYDALYIENLKFGVKDLNLSNLSSARVEIRDFKTSEVRNQEKADDKVKKNRQMSIYALSFLNNHGKLPDKVSLYFVDSGLIGQTQKNDKDIKKVSEEIIKVVSGIISSDFEPKPGWGECGRCAYHDICSFTQTEV
jgi:DNA helicase-2/ATP-dependent DNA helicase PcrA